MSNPVGRSDSADSSGPGAGREILDVGFPDDDGSVSQEVREALEAYAEAPDDHHRRTVAVLQHARLLVPVVAVLGESEIGADGLVRDKSSDMATVSLRGADGRMALLAFTGVDTLRRWNPEGRPVPVSAPTAAQAARHDGADALLVDVAGPVPFVIEGPDLEALAEGFQVVWLGDRQVWAKVGDQAEG